MCENLAKAPRKSILKSSSFDGRGSGDKQHSEEKVEEVEKVSTPPPTTTKQTTFDESNILETYHPVDKEYGHIPTPKEEPKSPFIEEELVQVLPELKQESRFKEYYAVKLGRKLLEEEEGLEEDGGGG